MVFLEEDYSYVAVQKLSALL